MLASNQKKQQWLLTVLVPFIIITTVIDETTAQNYQNTGFCSGKSDGNYPNPYDCHSFYICHSQGSQKIKCPGRLVFSLALNRCDFSACKEDADPQDRYLNELAIGNPDFCADRGEGFHTDPQHCQRFYRCINHYTYSFTCPKYLYFNPTQETCDWPRNVPCTGGRIVNTPIYPWNPRTTRPPQPPVYPWTPQARTTIRPPVNPWTLQPWSPNPVVYPWSTAPPVNPWTPKPRITQPPVYPWTPVARTTRPTPVNPWISTRAPQTYAPVPPSNQFGGCNRVVCYFVNWAQYRVGSGKQFPNDVDANLCSHMIFAFAKLVGNKLFAFEWNDEKMAWAEGNYEKAIKLKQINPALKVLLAVGGWNMGSEVFSKMASTPENRQEFITTTIKFLRDRNFDGIDIDWEYPAFRGSPPGDKAKHALLVTEMRAAIDQEAAQTGRTRLLLTAAVGAGKEKIDKGYDVPVLNRMLDFINLMAYDLHGSWETKTGHNSPLFADPSETGDDVYLNQDWATRYWIQNGASPSKLVLGLALYGRSFRLSGASTNTGIGAPVSGKGRAGSYTQEAGFLSYYEICKKINSGARVERNQNQRVPHMVSGRDWIGFDDPESLVEKVKYAKQMNLGGVMVWDLSMDDFRGAFCNQGKWPLMNAIINQCRAG